MQRLRSLMDELNVELYNPAGLNMLWPGKVAFLFVSSFCFLLGCGVSCLSFRSFFGFVRFVEEVLAAGGFW
ncbi:hypothetical protein BD626DRAFT_496998 [Schizophyllum amplum]|uniref:Uncharacterized protein n=1 Tax=Schizophyllum amplum TaxID=97359 RepID=A0A550CE02_9AGAR|nr:hypothetical protein BD626DRAFT_496998 [Auriculariopsis ampla]